MSTKSNVANRCVDKFEVHFKGVIDDEERIE
jgi:hypothetical protein